MQEYWDKIRIRTPVWQCNKISRKCNERKVNILRKKQVQIDLAEKIVRDIETGKCMLINVATQETGSYTRLMLEK